MIKEITITSLSGRGSVTMKTRDYQGYWLGPVDWGQVQGAHNTYAFHNQIGSDIVSTTIQTRPLSITGWVIDDEAVPLQTRCDFLNTFISPVEDYTLEYNGKKIQFRPDISIAYSREYIKNNEKVRRFLIQGTCPYPLFTNAEDIEVLFDNKKKLFHFPTDFGRKDPIVFAVTSKAYGVDVNNTGGFATGLIAKIEFSGEVKNPRLWNITTGKFDGINRTFQRGEQLEICTMPGSKHLTLYNDDSTTENLIKYRDYRNSWIMIEPGFNRLSLDCDDLDQRANMTATVYFTPLYLEVE